MVTGFKPIEVSLTPKQADKLLARWQRRLGLTDWIIDLQVLPRRDMPREDVFACIRIDWERRAARLCLLAAGETKAALDVLPRDMEVDLVHELLHIHINRIRDDYQEGSPEYMAVEQVINMLALSLVGLERGD